MPIASLFIEARRTLKLAWPIVISQMAQIVIQIVDHIMIGRVGATQLAAASFSNNIIIFFMIFALAMTAAVSILVAQADGADDKEGCGEVLRHSLFLCGIVGGVVSLGSILCIPFIDFFGQTPIVASLSKDYIFYVGLSLLPATLFMAMRQYSQGLRQLMVPIYILGGAIVLNIFLNWILIYGNLGMPAMELKGAGIATFVTRAMMMFVILYFILKSSFFDAYRPTHWFKKLHPLHLKKIVNLGFACSFQGLFEISAFAVAGIMVGWIGVKELAAHQIAINTPVLTFMFALGVSFAAGIRSGHAYGRKNYLEVRRIGFSSMALICVMMLVFSIILLLTRHWIPLPYLEDPEVIEKAAFILLFAAIFQIVDGLQAVAIGLLRSIDDIRIPTAIAFFSYWVLTVPVSYFLGIKLGYGLGGIWTGFTLGLTAAAILLSARFYQLTRRWPHEPSRT